MPFSAWQQRYFRLSNATLSYFAAPDDKVAKGSMVIDEACTVENAGDKYKKKFCFEVCGWARQLALCAECEEDCELWKAHINLTVDTIKILAARRGIKRGLLEKRDTGFLRKWRQKWVVLNRTTLSVYEAPDDAARQRPPSDEFELAGATVDTSVSSTERHFCFTIMLEKGDRVELSTVAKGDLNEWVKMLRDNVGGSTGHSRPAKPQPSWGVQTRGGRHPRTRSGSGWFDVKGIEEVTVVSSRQSRIEGERTTEYHVHVTHSRAQLSWHISRTLQDFLDLHAALRNTDPAKHEYLDKFIQVPQEKRSKSLSSTELEQHRKLIQVYVEEALKQAVSVDCAALGALLSPTDKAFDRHRGVLTVQRRARVPLAARPCLCEMCAAEGTFAWSPEEQRREQISVSLNECTLVTRKKLLPAGAAFELILPDRGVRILACTDDEYAATQWVECLKTVVPRVISETEGQDLVSGADSMFAVDVLPGESIPWLGAQTPDHTATRNETLWCSPSPFDPNPVRITDPQLCALRSDWDAEGSADAASSSSDDDSDDDSDEDEDGIAQAMASSRRRLSATAAGGGACDDFFRAASTSGAVVLDTGSHAIKAGFACQSFPSVVMRSVDPGSGEPLVRREQIGGATMDASVRARLRARSDSTRADGNEPVARAQISVNWDTVADAWEEIFHRRLGALLVCAKPAVCWPRAHYRRARRRGRTLPCRPQLRDDGGAGHDEGQQGDHGRNHVRALRCTRGHDRERRRAGALRAGGLDGRGGRLREPHKDHAGL